MFDQDGWPSLSTNELGRYPAILNQACSITHFSCRVTSSCRVLKGILPALCLCAFFDASQPSDKIICLGQLKFLCIFYCLTFFRTILGNGFKLLGCECFLRVSLVSFQCRSVKISIFGESVPVQVDGEAWMQPPGYIKIVHKNRAQMLVRDRVSKLLTYNQRCYTK